MITSNLKKQFQTTFVLILFLSEVSIAQALIPATSEDQEAFDQQLEQAQQASDQKAQEVKPVTAKARKANFGNIVLDEAKKLKDSNASDRKVMGQNTATQKRKNQNSAPLGLEMKDGRNSSPKLNNSGGAPSSPGQSGNRKK